MKTSVLKNIAIAAALLATTAVASAQTTMYWAPGGNNPVTGGSGTWDLSTANWNTTAYGSNGSATTLNYTAATLSGTTTSGSTTISMPTTTGVLLGQAVSGTGVLPNSLVTAISANASVTITSNANATGASTLTFARSQDILIFGGTGGTVTTGAPVSFGNGDSGNNFGIMRFAVNGYTVTGTSTDKINYRGNTRIDFTGNHSATVGHLQGLEASRLDVTGTSGGTLTIENSTILGGGSGGLKVGGTTSPSSAVTVAIGTGNNFANGYLRVNNASRLQLNGNNISFVNVGSDTVTDFNGRIENGAAADATLTLTNFGGSAVYQGILADGAGGGKLNVTMSKGNAGQTQTFAGTQANTYSGDTLIAGSSLILAKTAGVDAIAGNVTIGNAAGTIHDILSLGANNQIKDTSVISMATGISASQSQFLLNGYSETVGGLATLSGNGSNSFIRNGAATASTLTVNDASNRTFSGVIENGSSGSLSIVKSGIGSWTLNATNTYTGTTTISAGTLVLGSAGSIANSSNINLGTAISSGTLDITSKAAFTIGSGQTLEGHGSVNLGAGKMLTINGNLSPGNSPGVLSITGSLTLNGTTTMEINGFGTAGVDYDRVTVSGDIIYGGALVLTLGNALANDNTINIFSKAGYSGDFASVTANGHYGALTFNMGLPNIWTATASGQTFTFDQFSGDFNVIPEPSTWALLAVGLTAVVIFRRRRIG